PPAPCTPPPAPLRQLLNATPDVRVGPIAARRPEPQRELGLHRSSDTGEVPDCERDVHEPEDQPESPHGEQVDREQDERGNHEQERVAEHPREVASPTELPAL